MAERRVAVVLCALGLALACTKKEAAPHRTEPWLANPSASSSGAVSSRAPRTFRFAPDSFVTFSVPGRKGKVSGRVPLSQGTLRLDPSDPKTASASIDADLTRLKIDDGQLPEGLELGDAPTAIALNWLELGPSVPAERRAGFATAHFELASVEDLSAGFIDFAARKRTKVRATAVGTLLIHGFRAPVRAGVWLEPLGAGPGAAERLSIRSAGPLVIPLAPHDIGARGPSGIADALGATRAADWVGKSARIEFELVAEAEPRAPK